MCCATLINASEYGDIDPNFNHQDVSSYEKNEEKDFNNCKNKSTKGNEYISNFSKNSNLFNPNLCNECKTFAKQNL